MQNLLKPGLTPCLAAMGCAQCLMLTVLPDKPTIPIAGTRWR